MFPHVSELHLSDPLTEMAKSIELRANIVLFHTNGDEIDGKKRRVSFVRKPETSESAPRKVRAPLTDNHRPSHKRTKAHV